MTADLKAHSRGIGKTMYLLLFVLCVLVNAALKSIDGRLRAV